MNRTNRAGDLGRGLVSLAALVGLVIGVPVGLLRLAGSPLPSSVPRWSEVARALSESHVADTTLIKGAALICWIAWAVLVLCVVVELAAWMAGRTAARLPVVGAFQLWAARLVASALLVFSSIAGVVRPAVAVPTASRAPVARVANTSGPSFHVVQPGVTSPEEAAVATRPTIPEPAGSKRYIVDPPGGRHRDTLWGIAERHLGNPERWPEIFQLNKGRYTGGHQVTNPHWIYAGEELIMPADSVGLDGSAVPPAAPPAPPVPARDSSVQMRVVPDDQAQPQAAGKASDGWRLVHSLTDLLPTRLNTTDLVGAGMLAAGVVWTLDRRRRTKQRHRRPGAAFLVPEQELASVELALRLGADNHGADLVQLALKLLARTKRAAPVLGMRVGSRQVEIRFAEAPGTPEAPFRAADDGWILQRRAVDTVLAAEVEALPSVDLPLVTLGTTDDGETVLLNLQAPALSSIAGTRDTARQVLLTAATELAGSKWIERAGLVLVGFGEELANLPRVRVAASVAEVGDLERGDAVLSAEPPGDLTDLLPAGVVLFSVGPVRGTRCRLIAGQNLLEAEALDAIVTPQGLAPGHVSDIAKLLAPVADPVDDSAPTRPSMADLFTPLPFPDGVASAPAEEPVVSQQLDARVALTDAVLDASEVEVRVLGPIEIVGAEKTLTRAKSIELVVYLAMHREAVVDADRLREALWPGRPPGTTLYTTASVARNHLGKAADGSAHLPLLPGGERVYRLGDSVGSDYQRFAEGVRRAKDQRPADAINTLRAALSLVRGRPFDGASRGYEWAHVEGFITCIENEVAAAAHTLAQLCLEQSDAAGARWATRQGLRVSPGNEQLFRDEMYAADLDGNRAGVEALLNELTHIVEEDAPLESLHPDTVAVYNELTSGERAARLVRTG